MADNIFQQATGLAPAVTQAAQQASDLLQRVKAIAAASAAQSLMDPSLTTDAARTDWADDNAWHNLRAIFGSLISVMRQTPLNAVLRQYIAGVIAADEITAGLSLPTAPPTGGDTANSVVWGSGPAKESAPAPPAEATPAPQSTEGVIVPSTAAM